MLKGETGESHHKRTIRQTLLANESLEWGHKLVTGQLLHLVDTYKSAEEIYKEWSKEAAAQLETGIR